MHRGQAVSLAVWLDCQNGREAVCLDGCLLGWLICGQAVSASPSAWLSGWMVRMVVRLSAWLVDLWSGCELGRLAGGAAV